MRESARLFWRVSRFEILVGLAVSLALSAAGLLLASRMRELFEVTCGGVAPCEDPAFYDLNQNIAAPFLSAMAALPWLVGIVYGVAILARELERNAAPLSWWLARSRQRWLIWRLILPLLFSLLLLMGPTLAAGSVAAARLPGADPAMSFEDYGVRGPLVLVRGALAFAIALSAGGAFGRVLPAIVASIAVSVGILAATGAALPVWLPREVLPRELVVSEQLERPYALGEGVITPEGALLTLAEAVRLAPPEARIVDSPAYILWLYKGGFERVYLGIRGTRLGEVEVREGASLLLAATALLLSTAFLVRRRRPSPGLSGGSARLLNPERRPAIPWLDARPVGGMRLPWLLVLRRSRAELVGAVGVVASSVIATLVSSEWLHTARVDQGCLTTLCIGFGAFTELDNGLIPQLFTIMAIVPFAVGALLGAPLIAREFETGGTRLAWSLTGSRVLWLVVRVVPVAILMVGLLAVAAGAANRLEAERHLVDPAVSLRDYGLRGFPVVARGVAAFAMAVLAGAVLRRTLPALIVATIAGVVLFQATEFAMTRWLPLEVVPRGDAATGKLGLIDGVRAPDGTLYELREFAVSIGFTPDAEVVHGEEFGAWLDARGHEAVRLGIPGERLRDIEAREGIALLGLGAFAMATCAVYVRRARAG